MKTQRSAVHGTDRAKAVRAQVRGTVKSRAALDAEFNLSHGIAVDVPNKYNPQLMAERRAFHDRHLFAQETARGLRALAPQSFRRVRLARSVEERQNDVLYYKEAMRAYVDLVRDARALHNHAAAVRREAERVNCSIAESWLDDGLDPMDRVDVNDYALPYELRSLARAWPTEVLDAFSPLLAECER